MSAHSSEYISHPGIMFANILWKFSMKAQFSILFAILCILKYIFYRFCLSNSKYWQLSICGTANIDGCQSLWYSTINIIVHKVLSKLQWVCIFEIINNLFWNVFPRTIGVSSEFQIDHTYKFTSDRQTGVQLLNC